MYDFYLVEHGLMKKRVWKDGTVDEHPVLFPNILRHARETQIRVPVDDTHTQIYMVDFYPTPDGSLVDDDEPEVEYTSPFKDPPEALHPFARFTLRPEWLKSHNAQPEDHMAWETQGPIADRTLEHLSYSDKGIALYRKVLKENIVKVQAGLDPMAVVRDPDHEMIDTNLGQSLELIARPSRPAQDGAGRHLRRRSVRVGRADSAVACPTRSGLWRTQLAPDAQLGRLPPKVSTLVREVRGRRANRRARRVGSAIVGMEERDWHIGGSGT